MRPSKHQYAPLGEDSVEDEALISPDKPTKKWTISSLLLLNIILAVLLAISVFDNYHGDIHESVPAEFAQVENIPTKWTRFHWWTEYRGKNSTEVDALWDDILPSHDLVAVDREWAKEKHWPEAMPHPNNDSKRLYLLESYHLLHCVAIIRKTFWEAVNRKEYTYNPPHAGHCFDYLRQSIQCNADNTPLYTFGDYTAGDGQIRKCKDWDALHQWATEHTACYRDSVEDIPLKDHFGSCDDGKDNLIDLEKVV